MATESFTCAEFEKVLEDASETLGLYTIPDGEDQYRWAGSLKQGEHTYWLPLDATVALQIRSSIQSTGQAANSGEDSIRVWFVNWQGQSLPSQGIPLGSKLVRYVTRVKGWQQRLTELISRMNVLRLLSGNCDKCGRPLAIYTVKKQGANHGRLFAKCAEDDVCTSGLFKWLKEP